MKKQFSFFSSKKRFFGLFIVIFIVFTVVICRLAWLQIVRGEALGKQSLAQAMGTDVMLSPRGAIVDCNGEELAVSIMAKSLYVDPVEMEDRPGSDVAKTGRNVKRLAADLLAGPLGISADSLYADFTTEARFIWIKRTLTPDEADTVTRIIKENKLPGLHFWKKASVIIPKTPWLRRF